VTEDSEHAAWLEQARSHLRDADPVLGRLIAERPDFDPRAWLAQLPPMDLYDALLFQVAGQQLSVAATRTILARVEALFGGHLPAPAELLGVDPEKLRAAGLSWRKIGTLRDLAARMTDGRLDPGMLGGEDVVLPGDLALRKAVRAVYGLDHLPAEPEVAAIAENWRPYRSLATSYLFSAAYEPAEEPPAAPRET